MLHQTILILVSLSMMQGDGFEKLIYDKNSHIICIILPMEAVVSKKEQPVIHPYVCDDVVLIVSDYLCFEFKWH